MPSSRVSAACLAVGLLAGCTSSPAPPAVPQRLNVLLVTIDTLRADRVGRGLTPTLDALAARGLRFTHARSVVPLTLPAHASIMTGVAPPVHGVRVNGVPLSGGPAPLARRLRDAGYRTGASVGAFVLDRRFGLADGFESYDDAVPRDPAAVDRLEAERRADVVIDRAAMWLGTVPADAPWLLWVHLYDPHAPYDAPTGGDASNLQTAYDAEVAFVDRELARLLEAVRARADGGRTAVLVVGDHGESLGEHGEPTHGMLLFEPALRVPLTIAAPGIAPAERAEPVSLLDIAPTVLALTGLPADASLPGADITGPVDPARELYAETEYPQVAGWRPARALMQDRWKLVRSARDVLYDLETDPGERQDLAAARPTIVQAMSARAETMAAGDGVRAVTAPAVSAETADRLRALGYVASAPRLAAGRGGIDAADAIGDWARFEEALAASREGRAADALRLTSALVDKHPDAPLFHSTYGRMLTEAGQSRRALEVYRSAVRRTPDDPSLYHELATAARGAGLGDEALRAEQASLALDAAQPRAQNGLGLLFSDRGRHGDAARAFGEAVRLDPTNAVYLANLGNARRAMNDLAGAAAAYRQALDRDPKLADAANGLGVTLVQQKQAAEAVTWFERAVAAEPAFMEAHLNLGIALQESGDVSRAAEQYKRVLSSARRGSPEYEAATTLLGQLQGKTGRR